MSRAEEQIRRLESRRALAVRLAEAVSLAVLVDPPLLRKARLELVAGADPGTESDLWLSPLVQTRSPDGIVFAPGIAEALRTRLAANSHRLQDAWRMTQEMHRHLTPALRLEEEIAWLSLVSGDDPQAADLIEKRLQSALVALVMEDRRGLAHWAARALPKLPSGVRQTKTARMLEVGAHLRLGGDVRFLRDETKTPDWLPWVAPANLPRIPVAVRLFDRAVWIDARSSSEGQQLSLPKTEPLLIELSWVELAGRQKAVQVTLRPGEVQKVPVSAREFRLRTVLGEVYRLIGNADPPVQKARVFISTSSKEPEIRAIEEALLRELVDSPFLSPLMDREVFKPGDDWRPRINLWLGACDAAVIFLSRAALESDWVFYEASLLSYRSQFEPGFLFVPVYLDVDANEIEVSRFRTTNIGEIGAIRSAGRPVQEVVTDIVKVLEQATYHSDSSVKREIEHLAGLLAFFSEDVLREAAAQLHNGLTHELAASPFLLSAHFQRVGMSAAIPALLLLRPHISYAERREWVQKVVEFLGSSWIDFRSIDRIRQIAKAQEGPCAIGLNATQSLTAAMYIRRASREDPQGTWRFVTCGDILGESVTDLLVQMRQAIAMHLGARLEEVEQDLRAFSLTGQPYFVCLGGVGISNEILMALHQEFPSVIFFLLLGDNPGENLTTPLVEFLYPQLAPDEEQRILEEYRYFEVAMRVR